MTRLFRFVPLLAGASFRDRLVACVGSLVGIALTAAVSAWTLGTWSAWPVLVAPMGASAVLLFAVPASPLAQPWAVLGGNTISALIGVAVAHVVADPAAAAGIAVGAAILAMSLLRCLHPPGGAAALTAVIGGPAIAAAGWSFPLLPVALNSALLLGTAWAFHRFSGHSYPHRAPPVDRGATALLARDDIDRALEEAGETFDVSREDLDALLRLAERHAAVRRTGRR